MNVFVLNSGRCGSTSFIRACSHISNYSAGHESRISCIGKQRLDYPENHIEADNRLSWFLGRLDRRFGNDAFYVHLTRERRPVIASFSRRQEFGIMRAYREGILLDGESARTDEAVAADYLDTVEANISLFLRDKSRQMPFRLENAKDDFQEFWQRIAAEGDYPKALGEWEIRYNASE